MPFFRCFGEGSSRVDFLIWLSEWSMAEHPPTKVNRSLGNPLCLGGE